MRQLIERYNPFREPKWRMNRVLSLVDAKPKPARCSRRYDDQYVSAYRSFLLQWRTKTTTEERLPLFVDYGPMIYAHSLYHNKDREWRWIVEACILARMTDDEIANQTGMLPEAINLYEKLFFNVRDRIEQEIYICKTIIGLVADRQGNREGTLTTSNWSMLLKLFGYYGGPEALKVLLSGYQKAGKHPATMKEVSDWFDEATVLNIRRSSAMVARTYSFDRFSVMQLLEMHVRLVELQKTTESSHGPANAIEENVAALLTAMPFTAGRRAGNKLPSQVQPYLETTFELRSDESLVAARDDKPLAIEPPPPELFQQPKSSLKED